MTIDAISHLSQRVVDEPQVMEETKEIEFSLTGNYADIAQFALPICAGVCSVVTHGFLAGSIFAFAAIAQKIQLLTIKFFFPKERPDKSAQDSFPSGHTAAAFLAVGYVAVIYGFQASLWLLPFATAVAVNRVWNQKHHPSDVIFAAAQGFLNGAFAGLMLRA